MNTTTYLPGTTTHNGYTIRFAVQHDALHNPTRKDINTNLADQARYVTSHVHTLCEGIIANPAADENTVKHALDLERLARYLEWKTETLTKEGTEQC